MKRKILIAIPVLVVLLIIAGYQIHPLIFPKTPEPVQAITQRTVATASLTSDDMERLTNDSRVANGLKPLTKNSRLCAAASAKAIDMKEKGYWSHDTPDGKMPWSFFEGPYQALGENLAFGYDTEEAIVTGWMNSPGHRKNILDSNFDSTCVILISGYLASGKTEQATLVVAFYGKL